MSVSPRTMFTFRVRADRMPEYRARHAAVWPDMLRALHAAGYRNYSIFTSEDGLVVGYAEIEDLAATDAAMHASEVNTAWQAEMAQFFETAGPDEEMNLLTEAFHLETQLAAANATTNPATTTEKDA